MKPCFKGLDFNGFAFAVGRDYGDGESLPLQGERS